MQDQISALAGILRAASRRPAAAAVFSTIFTSAFLTFAGPAEARTSQGCQRIISADVVALEQAYIINRFGAFVPAGMMFALRDDVTSVDGGTELRPGGVRLRDDKRPRPLVLRVNEGDCLEVTFQNLLSPDWYEEGGIPAENSGRLPAAADSSPGAAAIGRVRPGPVSVDAPRTRHASFHVAGMEPSPIAPADCPAGVACGGDGTNVGIPGRQGIVFRPGTPAAAQGAYLGSLAQPGQRVVTRWRAAKEGAYFAYSAAAPVGGEGDGGQIGLGLFAAVNVEPRGSRWYRSQVSEQALRDHLLPIEAGQHPYTAVDYAAMTRRDDGRLMPVFAMLDAADRIVHSDLNAIVVLDETQQAKPCPMFGTSCDRPFREFTVIFHDEVHARQAFAELEDENNPLSSLRDGMGINYGVSSMGALVLAAKPNRATGPARECAECRAEEFFLSSWANGDPALILEYTGEQATGARYPDDPSNVHHSYLGDAVRFRNLHAGPKETHVFHLHAHQWVMDSADPNGTYLDSQTISPGATFSYEIEFGGTGNRNYTPGDSIFHCHLYPHFAQGMWELWRVHDTFEDGKLGPRPYQPEAPAGPNNDPRWRNLPDGEVVAGTATPALLPIPGTALAPLPTAAFPGYPFYIPGEAGHRPPQPVLDMDVIAAAGTPDDPNVTPDADRIVNGGLPRHTVSYGTLEPNLADALVRGGEAAQIIARRVAAQDDPSNFAKLAKEWGDLVLRQLPHAGTPGELNAMAFHEGTLDRDGLQPAQPPAPQPNPAWWDSARAYRTGTAARIDPLQPERPRSPLFFVNGQPRAPGAPYANPCPQEAPLREYRAAFIQTELVYNRHGWFDPQGRIIVLEDDIKDIIDPATRTRLPEPLFFRANSGECIVYRSTNLMPSALNVDDFQIITPTDTIGQHIHLVKFDVTSSDGSANGFNYEDATFSPEEVRERVLASNRTRGNAPLTLREHPLFRPGGSIHAAAERDPVTYGPLLERGRCDAKNDGETDTAYRRRMNRDHPFCGAQRTTQRWWADPILSRRLGPRYDRDNTLRTVFTHDHLGPSSHQQHGLYAGLVIEPANSLWVRSGEQLAPEEVALLPGPAGAPPLTLEAQADCALRARALARNETDPLRDRPGDPVQNATLIARCKLLGGSDLSVPTAPALRRDTAHPLAAIEPRPALRLRDDGGPTAATADIIGPRFIRDGDSTGYFATAAGGQLAFVSLQPDGGLNRPRTDTGRDADSTRREFALALADFGIAYNAALEPINPEPLGNSMLRDNSAVRFGRRHVAITLARPLGISSEDPGSQYVNYRHEPLALRISEATPDPVAGGFDYRQSVRRADQASPCVAGATDCLGDMANAFSTAVHSERDARLARTAQSAIMHRATRDLLQAPELASRLDPLLAAIEQWRRNFNCALYSELLLPAGPASGPQAGGHCEPRIERREPWRQFGDPATPLFRAMEGDRVQIRLIQGAQEAQHIFTMNGVKWLRQPASPGSGFVNAQPIGISEHFEADIVANASGAPSVDYLYFGSSVDQLWDGMWGILRVVEHPANAGGASQEAELVLRRASLALAAPLPPEAAVLGGGAAASATLQRARDAFAGITIGEQPAPIRLAPAGLALAPLAPAPQQLGASAPPTAQPLNAPTPTGAQATLDMSAPPGVAAPRRLAMTSLPRQGTDRERSVCSPPGPGGKLPYHQFDVSAVRACDLHGDCGAPEPRGIAYSTRFGIRDSRALVYVLNAERRCEVSSAAQNCGLPQPSNAEVLQTLRGEFTAGRPLEPLVLRAAAGACIEVTLRNHLPAELDDGPPPGEADGRPREVPEYRAYHNFLPMITDGFNVNQFRMSSTVGLSAARVAQNTLLADGSNVGQNDVVLRAGPGQATPGQGSLLPPCPPGEPRCGTDARFGGLRRIIWSATDFEGGNLPAEFGAVPLRSFGDPIKQPMHGLGGALVIGPEGSAVCAGNRFAPRQGSRRFPGGVSAEICLRDGGRYIDHVLVVQDAVNATRGGMPVENLSGAEEPDDYGVKALNYRTEPLWARRGNNPGIPFENRNEQDFAEVLSSGSLPGGRCAAGMLPSARASTPCDPETPVFTARAGEQVRLHLVHPGGHTRQQGIAVSGHAWNPYPWSASTQSRVMDPAAPGGVREGVLNGFGPMAGTTLAFRAGGEAGLAMDYLIRSQSSFLFDGGLWGLLRVEPAAAPAPRRRPRPQR